MVGDLYTTDPISKRKEFEMVRASLMRDRTSFEAHWQEIANFMKPRRTRWFADDKNRGDKRNQKIIDSTATFAADVLRSGMHAGLTSPARPWMKLTVEDPSLAEYKPVKEWLQTVTKITLTSYEKSNLYNVLPTTYGDMGVFGTAAMSILEDPRDPFRAYSYPIGSYSLGMDSRGRVDTFIRNYTMTVRSIVREFGVIPGTKRIDWSRLSTNVKTQWDRAEYNQTVEVCWIITPNEDFDPRKIESKYKPFGSCWFEVGGDNNKFLRERGFDEFPILAPRWEVTGEDTYGTECPGMTALGDVKQLQVGERRGMQAVEKMINPPLQAPPSMRNQKTSLLPGDVSYVTELGGPNTGIRPVHEMNFAIDKLDMKQQSVRMRIERAFYTDLFLMMASSDRRDITAREIDERHEEKLLALGPVLERSKDELHDPMVDRTFAMNSRNGMYPPPPEELHNVNLKVDYLSLMAAAQKLVSVSGHERFLQGTVQLAAAWPEARFKVNVNRAVDRYAEMLSVEPDILRTDDEADALMQAEQQAAAKAQQADNINKMAAGARNLSQTDMTSDNALTRLTDQVRGA